MRRAALALLLAATAAAPLRAETVRLTGTYYSDRTEPYLNKMAAEFHSANPGIDIKIEVLSWDDLRPTLRTALAAGSGPDIAIIGTRWLAEFVTNGQAEPLDRMMSSEFKSRFLLPFLTPGQIGGKTYGLPITATARALYYNKDLFAKAAIADAPATWDELRSDAAKLKATGVAGFGLQGKSVETDVYWYYALWTAGGEVVGKDGRPAFDSPAGVTSLTMYKAMIDDGLTEPNPAGVTRDELQSQFLHGRVAMLFSGPFLIGDIAAEAPDLNYAIAPVPKAVTSATYAVTDSMVLFKTSKVKAAAWKFLDFLFTKGARAEFNRGEGLLPTTKAEANDPHFTRDERLRPFLTLLPNARFAPTVTGWDEAATAVSDAVHSVYLGEATPEAALKAAAARADSVLMK